MTYDLRTLEKEKRKCRLIMSDVQHVPLRDHTKLTNTTGG